MKFKLDPNRNMGNYWLTMSDAMAFATVRTAIGIASDLRRDLEDKAKVLSPHHPVEIALTLLGVAEQGWGKGKASVLAAQIVELDKCEPRHKANAYKLMRDAIGKLPLPLWGQERLPARKEIMEDLEKSVMAAHAEIPYGQTKLEKREQEWRDAFASRRDAELKQKRTA